MKKLTFLFLMMSMCTFLTAQDSKTFKVSDFDGLTMSNSADVVLSQGARYSVEAKGSREALESLNVEVDDGTLEITSRKGSKSKGNLTVYVTAPEIKGIVISGSGDLSMKNGFDQEKLSIVISGSGDMDLKGKVDKLSIVVSGSGDIDAYDLTANKCSIVNSGSGDVEINVTGKLSVVCSGSGDVSYKGDPEKSILSSGSGEISKD